MHTQTRLVRRQSTHYFRARIPRDLQPYLGKSEEKFSLRTRDPAQARRLARQASVDFDARCASLRKEIERRQGGKKPLVIDDALINEICALWRHQVLAGDEHQRREGSFRGEWQVQKDERRQTAQALKETLAQSRLEAVQPALEAFLHLLGIDLRGSESRYRALLYRFLQTVAEVHHQQLRRDEGEVVWTPDPPEESRLATPAQGRVTFEDLFDDWRRFDPSRPQRTVDDVRRTLDDLLSIIGQKAADTVERTDVIRYREELIGRGLAPKTVNKKITFICALFNVGINNGKLDRNPAQRIPTPKSDSRHRLPFDRNDLQQIFRSPVFTERKDLGRGVRDAGRWIPLLALYQGCRVEELAQLLVTDVQCIDDVW